MTEHTEKQMALFSDETIQELEQKMSQTQDHLSHHLREAERCRQLIVNIKGILGKDILGVAQKLPSDEVLFGSDQNGSAFTPTEFVLKILNESPDRWLSVQEIMFKSRSAFEAGEVVNKAGKIENSMHSVLTRFRQNRQVWTRGKKASRKYKLKP